MGTTTKAGAGRGGGGGRARPPIERRAERQDGLLGPDDLRRVGRGTASHRRRSRRWTRLRRGVVRVTGAPPTWRQTIRAAVLAAGASAFASHSTGVRLYGLERELGRGELIELSAPLERKIRLAGVRSHRSGTLTDDDVRTVDGIRCSSPIRLVLDLSGRLSPTQLGKLVDELMRRKLLHLDDLRRRVDETRPAPGRSVRKLRLVLSQRLPGYDPGESTLEARIVRVIRRHGFPDPVQQYGVAGPAGRFRLDFAYPDAKVFLEGHGFGFHNMASDLDRDATRQNMLVGQGWRPLTFTWRMKDTEIVAALDSIYDRSTAAWRPTPPFGPERTVNAPERPNGGYGGAAWEPGSERRSERASSA